jgi:hypothetical protein
LVVNCMLLKRNNGSACNPVIVPVFKTGGWHLAVSPMGSTPIRFRQFLSMSYEVCCLHLRLPSKPACCGLGFPVLGKRGIGTALPRPCGGAGERVDQQRRGNGCAVRETRNYRRQTDPRQCPRVDDVQRREWLRALSADIWVVQSQWNLYRRFRRTTGRTDRQ